MRTPNTSFSGGMRVSDKKTVSRREFLKRSGGAVAYAAAAGPVAALAAETPRRPNVIFFLMDDMG
ncbi:MAG: twin-arginine translocation signal domain-containing protein, partial [Planctomycetes bacterium]|nr:twin-arginine translocation signal domain-containing protein [Planctomycetota bacterium]